MGHRLRPASAARAGAGRLGERGAMMPTSGRAGRRATDPAAERRRSPPPGWVERIPSVKIEAVESILAGRWHFVRITTDSGIVGVGESGIWGYPEASERIVDVWSSYLVGQDPLRIEHHWQYLYRNSHFMGSAVGGALGAIDIALWDIAGKHRGEPIYALLGGKTRDRIRCYIHVNGATVEELAADARRAVADGFTAVRFTPFRSDYTRQRYGTVVEDAIARVGAVR